MRYSSETLSGWAIVGLLVGVTWTLSQIRDALRDIALALTKTHLH